MGEALKGKLISDLFFSRQIDSETFIVCNKNMFTSSLDLYEYKKQHGSFDTLDGYVDKIKDDLDMLVSIHEENESVEEEVVEEKPKAEKPLAKPSTDSLDEIDELEVAQVEKEMTEMDSFSQPTTRLQVVTEEVEEDEEEFVAEAIAERAVSDLYFSKEIDSETFIFCNQNKLRNSVDVQSYVVENGLNKLRCSDVIKKDLLAVGFPSKASESGNNDADKAEAVVDDKPKTIVAVGRERVVLSDAMCELKLILFHNKNKFSAQALEGCVANGINKVGELVDTFNQDVELTGLNGISRSVIVQIKEFLSKMRTSAHIFAQDVSLEDEVVVAPGKKKTTKKSASAKKAKSTAKTETKKAEKASSDSSTTEEPTSKAKVRKVSLLDDAPATVVEKVSECSVNFDDFGSNPLNVFVKLNKLNSQVYQSCSIARVKTVADLLELKEKDPSLRKLGIRATRMKSELKKFVEYLQNPVQEKDETTEKPKKTSKLELDDAGNAKDSSIEILHRRKVISSDLYKFFIANSLDRLSYVSAYYKEYKSFDQLVGFTDELVNELMELVFEFNPKLKPEA